MNVLQSQKKVLLLFFDAFNQESLELSALLEEVNLDLPENYRIVKIDMATKKNLARKYQIEKVPSVLLLDKGLEIKRLDCYLDKDKLKSQL